jgi:F420-0:gamma-glutamyl ligase-like protein
MIGITILILQLLTILVTVVIMQADTVITDTTVDGISSSRVTIIIIIPTPIAANTVSTKNIVNILVV